MWNPGWDKVFLENEWGKYPPEELIRFVARNFYSCPDRPGTKILEVGCGTGANLWYLAKERFSVTGVDGSAVALERARKRLSEEGLSAEVRRADVTALPFDDGSFDGAIDIECLYANTAVDAGKALLEIRRVLRPGGLFFSKTFMVGTYGDGLGTRVPGEANTYVDLKEGAFHKGYGVIRFMDEREVRELYGGPFDLLSVDSVVRTEQDRRHEIREWLIVGRAK